MSIAKEGARWAGEASESACFSRSPPFALTNSARTGAGSAACERQGREMGPHCKNNAQRASQAALGVVCRRVARP